MPPPKKITPKAATPATPVAAKSEVKGSGTAKATPAAPRTPSYEEISVRAFEIYAGRGYASGDPSADWYEAERQLKAGL